jgi:mannose-6-phosphate isomerase-like protein (cupin superfamily)
LTKNGAPAFAITTRFGHTARSGLNDGIEITTQDVHTRLIAWPGNGLQTESVRVLTLAPGEESAVYDYDMSDEAMVCLKGQGEVDLRGEWVQIDPGDIAYFPERVPRALRNPRHGGKIPSDMKGICYPGRFASPPQLDL